MNDKERLFCYHFATCGDLAAAGAKAGLRRGLPGLVRLLSRDDIGGEIRRVGELLQCFSPALAARRALLGIALAPAGDAAALALSCGEISPEALRQLDLSAVAEIKFQRDKGLELKLCDRIKALALVLQHGGETGDGEGAEDFFSALRKGAEAIYGEASDSGIDG